MGLHHRVCLRKSRPHRRAQGKTTTKHGNLLGRLTAVPNRKLLTAMKTDLARFAARLDELACAGHPVVVLAGPMFCR